MQPHKEPPTYELDQISRAILRLDDLRAKAKPGSNADEFYHTIYEVMMALQSDVDEYRYMQRDYAKMVARVEIMEGMLAMLLKIPDFDPSKKPQVG